jgi:hypothetical protein
MSRGLERAWLSLSLSHKLNKMKSALAENGVLVRKSAVLVLAAAVFGFLTFASTRLTLAPVAASRR